MALPNPSMVFVPFDILTAAEMNDMVENDQALAAGTGLNDNAITSSKIGFTTQSTSSEIQVGTTHDAKPIYERTIMGTITIAANTRAVTAVSIVGITIVQVQGWSGYFNAGTRQYPLGTTWGDATGANISTSSGIYYDTSGATLTLITFSDIARSSAPYKIVLRYTKT